MTHIRGPGAALRLLALLVLLGGPSAISCAADEKGLPSDLAQVPPDGGFFMTIRAGDLAASKAGKELLTQLRQDKDNLAATLEKYLGLPLADIERVTVLPDVVIVRTTRPYDREKVLDAVVPKGQRQKHKDKTFYHDDATGEDVYFVDDQTYLRAHSWKTGKAPQQLQGGLQRLWDRPPAKETDLAEPLRLAAGKHQVVAGLTPRVVLDLFTARRIESEAAAGAGSSSDLPPRNEIKPNEKPKENPTPSKPPEKKPAAAELTQLREEPRPKEPNLEDWLRQLPPEALPYKPLFKARLATLVGDLDDELKLEVRVTFPDKDIARDGETSLRTLLYVLRELLPLAFEERGGHSEGPKQLVALLGQAQTALKTAKVTADDTTISAAAHMEIDPATVGVVARNLSRRAERTRIENSLHQIIFATINYADSYQGKMPAGVFDKAGKPLLSWRVAILPYIEQDALYKQFHLDEPWDSENNKKLIAKMPKVYAGLNAKLNAEGKTVFLAPSGPNTAWPGGPDAMRYPVSFTDGTANTILFVVADDAHAVEWTKPEDLKIDPKKPQVGLAQLGGMFLFGMADGSVHRTKTTISTETLWAAFTPNGAELLGPDW